MTKDSLDEGVETEAIVVVSEQGVVLTGSRTEAFEARIIESIRKPFYALLALLMILFVLLVGFAVILENLDDTVNNTDNQITLATGPEAAAQQEKIVKDLLDEMDCRDQRNLQKLVNELVNAGITQLSNVEFTIAANCEEASDG